MTLLAALLFGCSNGWQARCNQTLNEMCTLRVECGIEASFPACQASVSEDFYCNDLVSPQAFDPCIFRFREHYEADPPVCFDLFPSECSAVLCATGVGCDIDTILVHSAETIIDNPTTLESHSGTP